MATHRRAAFFRSLRPPSGSRSGIRYRTAKRTLLFALSLLALFTALTCRNLVRAGDTQAIRFTSSDGVELSGLLIKPRTPSSELLPAVVILLGSGPETPDGPGYRVQANVFVRAGFAVLVYDKRGAGASGGDFKSAIYKDFVEDALAAVAFLRTRPEVDPGRIGLFGVSEGGWLTPEVAARAGGITFIINHAGPPLAWVDTVVWEVENDTREMGFEGDLLHEIVDLNDSIWRYYIAAGRDGVAATAAVREEIQRRVDSLPEDPRLAEFEPWIADYDPARYSRLSRKFGYDPQPFVERLRIPMLFIFGEDDINIPTRKSVEYLDTLIAGGAENISYRIFEGVGHYFFVPRRLPIDGGAPAGYSSLLSEWAREHSVPSKGIAPPA